VAFLHRLRGWLGLASAAERDADLRERVESALQQDDAEALARALDRRREDGKRLIRTYESEVAAASPAERERIARWLTALVAVYAKAFNDPEPLSWFRPPSPPPPPGSPQAAADRAREAFQRREFQEADDLAAAALDRLPPAEDPARREADATESSLLALRGGVAAERQDLDAALDFFERAVAPADRSGVPDVRAAAHLNLFDLHTRRDTFPEDEDGAELRRVAMGTPFEDVAGKLLIERGIALTRRGSLPAAITLFDLAAELRPAWPFPLYQRAWARFLQGDSGGALDDYRDVAERTPIFFTVRREIQCLEDVAAGHLPIEAYRSFCLVRDQAARQPAAVETAAGRMLDRHGDFAPAHLLLAEARLALGRRDDARLSAREALAHDPDPDTAAAALFLEWNLARAAGEMSASQDAARRLRSEFGGHPAAEIVERLGESPDPSRALRWSWALDGTLNMEEVTPEDRTSPPPGSPG
jgi:tetratricopeptide (TPR) repeat protein